MTQKETNDYISKLILMCWGLFFLLTSCSTLPPPSHTIDDAKRQQRLATYTTWALSGKISVQEKNETVTAGLYWHQNGKVYRILLVGPVGTETLVIRGQPHQVTLETSRGQTSAENEEALLKQVWGKTLPIKYLSYWIRGLAIPYYPAQWSGDTQGARQLSQAGATIQYLDYTLLQGLSLPRKILITLPSAHLKIKIAIHAWQMTPKLP
jgi:outer membrane lipoprotein LolB